MRRRTALIALACSAFLIGNPTHAKSEGQEGLAKEAQNPIANLISLPIQSNTNFGLGPYDRVQEVINIQPVIPIKLTEELNLITRWILPIVVQPDLTARGGSTTGLGDLNPSFFFSPAGGNFIWGAGPTFVLPTRTSSKTGVGKWGAGPSLVAVYSSGAWVLGGLVNNIWTFDGGDVNQFLVQPFLNYNLPNGWYLTSSPVITSNWKAPTDNRWTLPLGGGVGKLFTLPGFPPINTQVQGYANVLRPQAAADATLRVQVQLLFPKG